jgi:pentatricopeptide repeat protein
MADSMTSARCELRRLSRSPQAPNSVVSSSVSSALAASINEFGVAAAVIEETTRMVRYYNILVVAKCKVGNFIGACEVFDEMRKLECDPDTNTIP